MPHRFVVVVGLIVGAWACWGWAPAGDAAGPAARGVVSPPGLVTIAAGGGGHSCALLSGGEVKCWGANSSGQVGDGTQTDRSAPVAVSGLGSGVTAIGAGWDHSCAVTAAGGVRCWGYNGYGQLGDGTYNDASTPVAVSTLASGVAAVSAGRSHTCALTSGGGVKCWGDNVDGALGTGAFASSTTPMDVFGLSSGVTAISAGSGFTCALMSTGGVKCWGLNYYGQLGIGSSGLGSDSNVPVAVSGLSDVAAIAAGASHACAVTSAHQALCWGWNLYGQLGKGDKADASTPVAVDRPNVGFAAVSAGWYHTCAVSVGADGWCWGDNELGQVGDGTNKGRITPSLVSGTISQLASVSTHGQHTCAATRGGGAWCWGYGEYGQLGNSGNANSNVPVAVTGYAGTILPTFTVTNTPTATPTASNTPTASATATATATATPSATATSTATTTGTASATASPNATATATRTATASATPTATPTRGPSHVYLPFLIRHR